MISAADFSDLFPSMVERERGPTLARNVPDYHACPAQWDDQRGQALLRRFGIAAPLPKVQSVAQALTDFWITVAILSVTNTSHPSEW